jgi:glycosyltransferase involved in cell wall biosynthesis
MKFSVIVPVFNAAPHLSAVIESLLSQDYPQDQYEVILVDNGSTDTSIDIIRRYSRVCLLTEPKQSSYAARNRALREASGEILAFTDSACIVDPGWLRAIESEFARSRAQVLLGCTRPAQESGIIALLADYEDEKAQYVTEMGRVRQQYGFTRNLAMRRVMWEKYGPFPELQRGSDVVVVRRIADQEPYGSIAYCAAMRIRHLEWDGLASYCRKMAIYGASIRTYSQVIPAEALSFDDRIRILLRTLRRPGYGAGQAFFLCVGLVCGFLAWIQGNRSVSLRSSPPQDPGWPQTAGGLATLPSQRVSLILEWDNVRLAERARSENMLRVLATQIQECARLGLKIPLEVIAVVPGSPAETSFETLSRCQESIEFQVVSAPGLGYYELKNIGARQASGEILVFLDSDTIPEQDWLPNLLAPLSDTRVAGSAGQAYIETSSFMGRAFAAMWFFPVRSRTGHLEIAKTIFAIRRSDFLTHPFRSIPGTSRGACIVWREELLRAGLPVMQTPGALIAHPPPNGAHHFFTRAMTDGRDLMLLARHQKHRLEAGLFGTVARFGLNLVRSTFKTWTLKDILGIKLWEVPTVLGVSYTYYATYFAGELITHLFPDWMSQRFRI